MVTNELINEFDNFLKKYCNYAYDLFDPPLSKEITLQLLNKLGIKDENYVTLYCWKNGIPVEKQDYSVDLRILMGGNFISLSDAIDMDAENISENYWKASLKPFFANYEGEHYLVETDELSAFFGSVYFYSPNLTYAVDPILYFDNLETMIKSIMAFFRQDAQKYNPQNGKLEFDFRKVTAIRKELNPKAASMW